MHHRQRVLVFAGDSAHVAQKRTKPWEDHGGNGGDMGDFIGIYGDSLLIDDGWWCNFTILKKYELVSLGRMTSHI